MASYYICYHKKTGRLHGHVYGDQEPAEPKNTKLTYRKLSPEELDLTQNKFEWFKYNDTKITKFKLVYFSVAPSPVYEIGVDNKISISVKADYDTTEEEKTWLSGRKLKLQINDEPVNITFDDNLFLNPTQPGTYVIKLVDPNVYSQVDSYVVSVIQSIQP